MVPREMTIYGFATYYILPGSLTAYGERYDADAMTAAMTPDRAPRNADVRVQLVDDTSKFIIVRVNDTGPFARSPDGRPVKPLQPDPEIIIDLTPTAFRKLAGELSQGKVRVTVEVNSA